MSNLTVKLNSLEQKIQKVLTEYKAARKEATLLKEENVHLKSIIIDKEKEITE